MAVLPPPLPEEAILSPHPLPEAHMVLSTAVLAVAHTGNGAVDIVTLPPHPTTSVSTSPSVTENTPLTKAPAPPELERNWLEPQPELLPAPPPAPHNAANMREYPRGTVREYTWGEEGVESGQA
jgi:hypothetical protein